MPGDGAFMCCALSISALHSTVRDKHKRSRLKKGCKAKRGGKEGKGGKDGREGREGREGSNSGLVVARFPTACNNDW